MCIIYTPVQEIEYVAEYNWRKCHGTPILGQTVDTKRLGDKGWKDTEKEAVGHCNLMSCVTDLVTRKTHSRL